MAHSTSSRIERKKLLALIAAGLLVPGLALGALQLQMARAAGADAVARALAQGSGLRARVARTELRLAGFELLAYGVALDGPRGEVLRARELRIRPSLLALLRGRIDLRSLELSGAALRVRSADLRERARARKADWPFGALSARDCKLRVEDDQLGNLELPHAQLELDAHGPSLRVTLRAEAGTLARAGRQLALSQLRVRATLAPNAIELEQALLQAQGVRLLARAASFALPLGSRGEATLELDAELARAQALLPSSGLPALAGQARARGRLVLNAQRVSGEGKLELTRARIAGRELGAHVQLDLRAGADGLELAGTLPLAPAGDVAFSATPRLTPDALALDPLKVRRGGSELRGRAQLTAGGSLALELAGDQVELAELVPLLGPALTDLGLRGRGRLRLQADGPIAALAPRMELDVDGFAIRDAELGKLSAALQLAPDGRGLRFERAELSSATRKLSADELSLQLDQGLAQAGARLRVSHLPLSDLYRLLGAADDALLRRLQADVHGNIVYAYARPRAGARGEERVELELELQAASIDGYRFDRGKLRARVATPDAARGLWAGTLVVQELALGGAAGTVTLSGEIPSAGPLQLQLAFERLALERLPWIHAHAPAVAGLLRGSGKITGSGDDPHAELELTLDELSAGGRRLGRLPLRAELRRRGAGAPSGLPATCSEGRAALDGGALGGDGAWLVCGDGLLGERVHVDLAVSTTPALAVRGVLAAERLDLAPLLPVWRAGEHVRGELDATLRITDGGLLAPEQLSAVLAVRRLELGKGVLALASSKPFELQLTRGVLQPGGGELVGKHGRLALAGGGSLKQGLRLTATGKAAAGLLAPVVPHVREAYGDMDVRIELASGGPGLRGEVELREVLAELAPGVYLRNVTGKLLLQDSGVRVQDLSGQLGGGTLRANGTVGLNALQLSGYDLELAAEHVAFEPQEKFEVEFDARGTLRSQPSGPPKLAGKLTLLRVLYGRHIELPEALIALNRSERESLANYDPARDRLGLELEIEHRRPLQIRNNFLDAEVGVAGEGGILRIVGSDQRFGLLGQLRVLRGRVHFRGDEFQITRGQIAFRDAARVLPSFEVRAVAERKKRPDANILFLARGDRDAFDLEVRCDLVAQAPRPFTCDFAQNRFRCDSFDELVKQWLCRPSSELSSAP